MIPFTAILLLQVKVIIDAIYRAIGNSDNIIEIFSVFFVFEDSSSRHSRDMLIFCSIADFLQP